MNDIAKSFSDIASFLVVYIAEAHASDVWPLGNAICIPDHKTIEDRIKAAKKHILEDRKCGIPILVDTISNEFDYQFNSWPERFYILLNNKLEWIAKPSDQDKGFDRKEIENWLNQYKSDLEKNTQQL